MAIIGKIINKVLIDDCVIREEPEVLTRWQDPTIKEYKKEIDRLNNAFDELEKYLIEGTKEEHYEKGDMFFNEACGIILNKLNELRNK